MPPKLASDLIRSLAAGSALALAAGFSGCAHTYNVKVDALCNPNVVAGASYHIVAKDEVKADFDPNFGRGVQLIETALATRGFFPALSPRDADMVVEVDFGVGSRRKRVTEDVDLFGRSNSITQSSSPLTPSPARTNASSLVGEPVPAQEPPMTRVTVINFYEKYLTLSARETPRVTQGLRKPAEIWRITVAVEDAKPTVDECLPVLVVTAADNLGTSTGARTHIRVSDKAPAVVLAKNDL